MRPDSHLIGLVRQTRYFKTRHPGSFGGEKILTRSQHKGESTVERETTENKVQRSRMCRRKGPRGMGEGGGGHGSNGSMNRIEASWSEQIL